MYLTIDIGGTKILFTVFTPDGTAQESIKVPTPHDFEEFSSTLSENIKKLSSQAFDYCVIGMPGLIDRENGVFMGGGNLTWKNVPLAETVSNIINCPVSLENDANLAGLSEAILVRDTYKTALYITISTGIGGGFIVDGRIEPALADAEIGKIIFRTSDGTYKTWEHISSGKTLSETYGMRASDIDDLEIWHTFTENIAAGIINVSTTYTPEVIIIGGGAGSNLEKFREPLLSWIEQLRPNSVTVPPIILAQRPEEAVVYGALELARQNYESTHQ